MSLNDLSFLDKGADWPPKGERSRLDAYNAHQKLFEGTHNEVFEDWPRLLRQDIDASLEIILNWPKRLSTLWADLLAGDPPTFAVGEKGSAEQDQLDAIIERNQFPTLLYDVAIDVSRYGDGLFKITLEDYEAYICGQSPSYWYPVVHLSDVRKVKQHVLAWPFTAQVKSTLLGKLFGKDADMLKVEIHEPGKITHRVLIVGKNKKIEGEELVVGHFPDIAGEAEDDSGAVVEYTGIDEFLVQQAPGLRPIDRLHGLDDYTDLMSIVQEMEARLSQIGKILDKHADPSMYGPHSALQVNRRTGEVTFTAGGRYIAVETDETPPGYLVWDGQLASAFQELEELKAQFWLVTETSPAAFGQLDAAITPSGTALRRLMQAPLAKARRLRMRLDPVAKKVLKIAAELENGGGGMPLAQSNGRGVVNPQIDPEPKDEEKAVSNAAA